MAFENELKEELLKYLDEECKGLSERVLDGSCKSLEEYRELCGKLRAYWNVGDEIGLFHKRRNTLNKEAIDDAGKS